MLRVLPPMFKPVNNLICCQTGLMWVVKHATSLFNSFAAMLQDKLYVFFFCCPFSVSLHAYEECKGVHIVFQMMTVVLRK